ncbi:MAG TPA: hypothetical protein VFG15_15835 [Amycolatopsis sp.]|nr:hypothetical protein [Amycolatopsis sp.]
MVKPHKAVDGVRDSRTQDERYGDAFTDYVRWKTTSRNLPGQAGEATHILVTMSYDDLIRDIGEAHLDLVGPISATDARILALRHPSPTRCTRHRRRTAGHRPIQTHRVPHPEIRIHPPRRWLRVPRVVTCPYPAAPHTTSSSGATTAKPKWKVRIAQDGLPEFTTPAYLDPTRTPRRNTMHLRV